MKKCPKCNSSRYRQGPLGKVCKRCGFRNDPNYLKGDKKENDKDNHR